jgi:hypothetical protein
MAKKDKPIAPTWKDRIWLLACLGACAGFATLFLDDYIWAASFLFWLLPAMPGVLLWPLAIWARWHCSRRLLFQVLRCFIALICLFNLGLILFSGYSPVHPAFLDFASLMLFNIACFSILFSWLCKFDEKIEYEPEILCYSLIGLEFLFLLIFSGVIGVFWSIVIGWILVWATTLIMGILLDTLHFRSVSFLKNRGYTDTSGMDFEPLLARYGGAILRDVPPWEEVGVVPGGADKSQGDILAEIFEEWAKAKA